jgi:hypothetical protein
MNKINVLEKGQECDLYKQESSDINTLDHMNWLEEVNSMLLPSQTTFTITKRTMGARKC